MGRNLRDYGNLSCYFTCQFLAESRCFSLLLHFFTIKFLFFKNCPFPMTKYIIVSGGVISGIGKGVLASSTGLLLKTLGLRVTAIKIDPYLNIDAGTLSPLDHGEVFVLDDGGEVDLDLGNYASKEISTISSLFKLYSMLLLGALLGCHADEG